MVVRSTSELVEFLDRELSWRKRELTTLKLLIARGRASEKKVVLRGAICMLYAHWEGFIKLASMAYVAFVSRVGLQYRDLSDNFIAVGLKAHIKAAGQARRSELRIQLVEMMLSGLQVDAAISWKDAVDTESNLTSAIFRDVVLSLGLDFSSYATKGPLIDGRLLDARHKIAHGERLEIVEADYDDLHSEVISLLGFFRDDIVNAAVIGKFRRQRKV